MTGFFERIVHGARAPIGALAEPPPAPEPLEVAAPADDAMVEDASPPASASLADVPLSAVERAPERAAAYTPAQPTRRAAEPRSRVEPSTAIPGGALVASPSQPLRGAGVRAAVVIPKADDRPAFRAGANARTSGSSAPTVAGAGDAGVVEEMERRWHELGSRLLASHPPKDAAAPVSAPSPVRPSAPAPPPVPSPRAFVRDSTRKPLDATPPRAPALAPGSLGTPAGLSAASTPAARRDAPLLRSPASSEPPRRITTARAEPKHDEPAGVVIQSLEVTVAGPPPAPPPAPPRARAEARGGAFSLAARRYLTRI